MKLHFGRDVDVPLSKRKQNVLLSCFWRS